MIDFRKTPNPPILRGDPIWTYMLLAWTFLGLGIVLVGALLLYMLARIMGMSVSDDIVLVVGGLAISPFVFIILGLRLLDKANKELCKLRADHIEQLKTYGSGHGR